MISAAARIGCGDPPPCQSEVFVAFAQTRITQDRDSVAPGVQTDVQVRSSLRDGEEITLEIFDPDGTLRATQRRPVDHAGAVAFTGVSVPTPRVVLGLIAAAALAAAGLRLRRTERSFGSSLLGLSLAVIHVCAWGAGPGLHLVPESVAFGMASLASAALALLARIEGDEPLWCVGFVGARRR